MDSLANPCEPISAGGLLPKESLNFGVSVYSPVSSMSGSATFYFLQPLLKGNVFASIGLLIVAQIILFVADRFFGLESIPIRQSMLSSEQTVQMSLSDLQDFLASMSQGAQPSADISASSKVQGVPWSFNSETPEIPLALGLTVWGDFSNRSFSPSVFLLLPVITFPGARGALPLLILELLTTIFVRSVVPPQTTGSKPLTPPASDNSQKILQFSPEDLLNLLNRFSKHFGT